MSGCGRPRPSQAAISFAVDSSSSPSSKRDGAPSLAASCAAGPVPPLDELLPVELPLEELALEDLPPEGPLPDGRLPEELPLEDIAPEELLLDEPLLELEPAEMPSVEAATIECDVGPHGSVPVKG